ncbi:uncharacterized protein ACOB8E_013143 isoform 2-T2 [Sarcophilus harrisii]
MCLESREWIRGPRILVYTAAALGRAATCRAAAPFRRRGPGPGRPKRPRLAFGSTLWSPRSGLKDPSPYIGTYNLMEKAAQKKELKRRKNGGTR